MALKAPRFHMLVQCTPHEQICACSIKGEPPMTEEGSGGWALTDRHQ